MNPISHINLAGAGNVATHLAIAFRKQGLIIPYIYNRSPEAGMKLARKVGARYTSSPGTLSQDADLIILAVSDDAISPVCESLHAGSSLVVHTSGSADIRILQHTSSHTGVFYPLQTFRKGKRVSFSSLPVCIEANHKSDELRLQHIALLLGATPCLIRSDQRKVLHIGAVIAGNFSNFCYAMAEELVEEYALPFDLLKPLIRQTAANIRKNDLFLHQTGPAIRGDDATIEAHMAFLERHPEHQKMYRLMTKLIHERKHTP